MPCAAESPRDLESKGLKDDGKTVEKVPSPFPSANGHTKLAGPEATCLTSARQYGGRTGCLPGRGHTEFSRKVIIRCQTLSLSNFQSRVTGTTCMDSEHWVSCLFPEETHWNLSENGMRFPSHLVHRLVRGLEIKLQIRLRP